MKSTPFFQYFDATISQTDQKKLFESLRLDKIVWEAFIDLGTVKKIVESLGQNIEDWNLGSIALIHSGLSLDIRSRPISEKLYLKSAVTLFETIRNGKGRVQDLKQATLLGLALYERGLKTQNWHGILTELGIQRFESRSFFYQCWRTPLAILYSLLDYSQDFLIAIADDKDENLAISLVNHIISVQLFDKKKKANIIKNLVENSPMAKQISWYQSFPGQLGFMVPEISNVLRKPDQYQFETDNNPISSFKVIEEKIQEHILSGYKNVLEKSSHQANAHFKAAKETTNKLQNFIDLLFIRSDEAFGEYGYIDPSSDTSQNVHFKPGGTNSYVDLEGSNTSLDNSIIQKLNSAIALKEKGEENRAKELATRDFYVWLHERQANWPAVDEIELLQKIDHRTIIDSLKHLELADQIEAYLSFLDMISKNNPIISAIITDNIDQFANSELQYEKYKINAAIEPANAQIQKNLRKLLIQKKDWETLYLEWETAEANGKVEQSDWFDYANAACNAGKIEEAKKLCEKLASHGMEDALVYSINGKIQFLEGEYETAKISLKKALQGDATSAEAWLTLAEIFEVEENFNEAITTLRSAVLAVPESDEIHYALARVCLHQNLFAEALPYLRKAIALNSEDENYYINLIHTLKELGHLDESQRYLLKAKGKWANNPELAFMDAQRCLENDNREQALASFEIAISAETGAKPEWLLLYVKTILNDSENQFSLTEQNKPSMEHLLAAQKTLQAFIKQSDEKKTYAHILLAEVLFLLNEFEAAHSIYLDLVDNSQKRDNDLSEWTWRISAGLGLVKNALGEIEMGLVMLKDSVSYNPNHVGIKQALAEAYLTAKLNNEASQMAMEAYNLCATDVRNLIWYASFMKKLSNENEVIKALEYANLLSNDNPELAIQLANEYVIVGNLQAANSTLASLLNQVISDYSILRKLTMIFLRLENFENAYQAYKKGILTLSPLSLENQLELIYLCVINNKWQEGLEHIQKLISQNYTFGATFSMQAEVLMGLKQYSSALDAYDQSLQAKKKLAEYLLIKKNNEFFVPLAWIEAMEKNEFTLTRLAGCAIKANQFEKSLASINQVIRLQPSVSAYKLFAADISLQLNDYETAYSYLSTIDMENLNQEDEVLWPIKQAFDFLINRFQRSNGVKKDFGTQFKNPLSECLAIMNLISKDEFSEARTAFLELSENLANMKFSFGSENISVLLSQTWKNLTFRLAILCAIDLYEFQIASGLINDWQQFTNCDVEPSLFTLLLVNASHNLSGLFSQLGVKSHRSVLLEKQASDDQFILQLQKKASQKGSTEFIKNYNDLLYLSGSGDENDVNRELINGEGIPSLKYLLIRRLLTLEKIEDVEDFLSSSETVANNLLTFASHQLTVAPHKVINLFSDAGFQSNPLINMTLSYCHNKLNNISEALEYCKKANQTWSDEENWQVTEANLYESMGENGKAMNLWEKIIKESDSIKTVIIPYLDTLLKNGKSEEVLKTLETYKKDLSSTFEYHYYQSQAFLMEGKVDLALKSIQISKNMDSQNMQAVLQEGYIFVKMQQYEKAKQNAYQVIQKNPENVAGYLLMISILETQKKYQDAVRMAEKALVNNPESHELKVSLAWNLREIGNLVEALKVVSQMTVEDSEDWEAFSLLALLYNDLEDFQAAEENAKKSLRISMEQPGILLLLGGLLKKQGHLDQALEYFSKAAAINSEDVISCLEVGDIYFDQQNYPNALDAYQEAILRDSNDARAYYKTGQIMKEVKDYQGAEKMLRMAANLSPKDASIRRQLAGVIALNFVHSPLEAKQHVG